MQGMLSLCALSHKYNEFVAFSGKSDNIQKHKLHVNSTRNWKEKDHIKKKIMQRETVRIQVHAVQEMVRIVLLRYSVTCQFLLNF